MVTWTAYAGIGSGSWSQQGLGTFVQARSTSTMEVYTNPDGTETILRGTGFTGVPGSAGHNDTTLTSVDHVASDGTLIEQITGFDPGFRSGYFFEDLLAGNDTLIGSSGPDQLFGGAGDDQMTGGPGADDLRGGTGNNTFVIAAGDWVAATFPGGNYYGDSIENGAPSTIELDNAGVVDFQQNRVYGIGVLHFAYGTSTAIFNGAQISSQSGAIGLTTIVGGPGSDALVTGATDLSGLTFVNWTPGVDTVTMTVVNNGFGTTVKGSSQNDLINLSSDGVYLSAGTGDDLVLIAPVSSNVLVYTDILGGDGNDTLKVRSAAVDFSDRNLSGVENLVYDAGVSTVALSGFQIAAGSFHTVTGSPNADALVVNNGFLFNARQPGATTDLSGLVFTSWTDGIDTVTINGIGGGNTLIGSSRADTIKGGTDADTLSGGGGNDILIGGGGPDALTGGSGADTFQGTSADMAGDTITDLATGDKIWFTDATLATFSYSLSNHVLTYSLVGGVSHSLTIADTFAGTLVASADSQGGVDLAVGSYPSPVAVRETAAVGAGATVTGTGGIGGTGALHGDSDPSGLALSVSAISGGTLGQAVAGAYGHLTLAADGSYSYVADAASALTSGSVHDIFSFTVSNGQGGTAASALDITVAAPHLNPAYRFYDTVTNDHFYTLDPNEKASIQANLKSFSYEHVPWATPDKAANTVDVFRFYDTATGTHFLTNNAGERDFLIASLPSFKFEGVAFEAYANPGVPDTYALERFYNTISKVHTYAADANEVALIKSGAVGQGWVDEGASFIVHTPTADMLHI